MALPEAVEVSSFSTGTSNRADGRPEPAINLHTADIPLWVVVRLNTYWMYF